MSSMEPFDLGHEVSRLISLHSDLAGTTLRGAIRDVLTEVARVCHEHDIDFDERVDAAAEVAAEKMKEVQ